MSSATENLPKPMVKIGDHPIIWHIMQTYSYYNYSNFIICGGYKIKKIKKYFKDYHLFQHNIKFYPTSGRYDILEPKNNDKWSVSVINTGLKSQTGFRLKQISNFVEGKFFLTYGDGLCDINIENLLKNHNNSKKICTMSSVRIQNKFGVLDFDDDNNLKEFNEKPTSNNSWINAGYFVCEKEIFDYIPEGNNIQFEKEPIQNLIKDNQLNIFKHDGFWKCMDTKKDYLELQEMWLNNPKWKIS
jgi:glucose-1-phosphate cytidylyltransferase